MSTGQKVMEILRVAGLRIITSGQVSEGQRLALQAMGPKYSRKQLAQGLRMLASVLDKEEEVDG